MAQEERAQPAITSLPRVEDLPVAPQGYDRERVQDAFEAFRRHVVQLQAQLRVLQAAGQTGAHVDPTGHAVRMDALHLIRAAAEFADTLERVCVQTVEEGKMTKDLALLIGPDQPWQTTQEFLASIDENLQKAMA